MDRQGSAEGTDTHVDGQTGGAEGTDTHVDDRQGELKVLIHMKMTDRGS